MIHWDLTNSQRNTLCKSKMSFIVLKRKNRTNKKRKDIIFLILLFCVVINTFGQNDIKPTLDLDNYKSGLSPQVALINKFVDFPVDLQYGLVDISVPLYTIKTNNLTVPLQLKFHASGLMANEREGLLGIRWALAGGGQVTRIIKGYPDEMYSFNTKVNNPSFNPDFATLFGTTGTKTDIYANTNILSDSEYKDTEYDIYNYCLPSGKSGKFIFKLVSGQYVGYTMPYEPLKISGGFNGITIIDEDGIVYHFGIQIKTNKQYHDTDWANKVTTWHLCDIISANKTDTIFYNYTRTSQQTYAWDKSLKISYDLHDFMSTVGPGYSKYLDDAGYGNWVTHTTALYDMISGIFEDQQNFYDRQNQSIQMSKEPPYYPSNIILRGNGQLIGTVYFNYTPDNQKPNYLSEIQIKDNNDNIEKIIGFKLKQNTNQKMNFLDKIEYKDKITQTSTQAYKFDYFDSYSAVACGELSKNADWWGYASNSSAGWLQSQSFDLPIPNSTNGNSYTVHVDLNDGNKISSEEMMKLGMIQKITYPTGGTDEFDYEANKYGVGYDCGGLRTKEVKKNSGNGQTEKRTYAYSTAVMPAYLYPPASGSNINTENEIQCFGSKLDFGVGQIYEGEGFFTQKYYQNTFPSRYTDIRSTVVNYENVTEHIENGSGKKLGKTVYNYDISLPAFSWYDKIDGYGEFVGGWNYQHGYVSPTDCWRGNKLKSKVTYDNSLTNKVNETFYEYTPYDIATIYDMPVFRYRQHMAHICRSNGEYSQTDTNKKLISMLSPDDCSECLSKSFAIKHQKYTIGVEKLSKLTNKTYNSDGSTTTVIQENVYDPLYTMLIQQKITNSDGITTRTDYEYPFNTGKHEEDQFGDNLYTKMANMKNILTPIISKMVVTLRPEARAVVDNITKDYFEYSKGIYYPASIENTTTGTSITYNNYTSNGLPQYLVKNNSEKVVYIWSYNKQYPVAEIKNASYADVVTQLGGETKLNEIAVKNELTEVDLALLNSLRTTLPQAQINTYTYTPLIGRTSATDPRGITTYYEYDGMNRLKEVYRKNGTAKEIINHYEYSYANK